MAKKDNDTEYKVFYMLIGMTGGISLGVAFNNLTMCMVIGMSVGTMIDSLVYSAKKKEKKWLRIFLKYKSMELFLRVS